MSQKTILNIDDSATIRRLVDSQLSQEGYRVVLAPTAEEGIAMAAEVDPAVILLDHQLPGTTGLEVCRQLMDDPELRSIPVVVSSTLRNKAYSEYTEMANVVDMLPKPYTPELLKMTIQNAVDTGALVVASQSDGTAVPEVINEMAEGDLNGTFGSFGLREILDFLNNGQHCGGLEVETSHSRVTFYLEGGRLQAVAANGVDVSHIEAGLPESLRDLGPVLKFTVGGKTCAEVDGLVELLDRKVLDPRLLKKLLRHQAAVLTGACFGGTLRTFRFQANARPAALFAKIPLNVSLVALLVDAAQLADDGDVPAEGDNMVYVRAAMHGQNLDRSGLSAPHMQLFGLLNDPISAADLARQVKLPADEVARVLQGFCWAGLVDCQMAVQSRTVVAVDSDVVAAQELRAAFAGQPGFGVKVVRDRLGLQLLLKRAQPDVLLVSCDDGPHAALVQELVNGTFGDFESTIRIALRASESSDRDPFFQAELVRPFRMADLVQILDGPVDQDSNELAESAV